MRSSFLKIFLMMFILIVFYGICYGKGVGFRVTNEMIYEKLLEIERKQAIFEERFKQIDKRFEQIDKRFEELRSDMNARFEQIDKRFEELREDMNARFEQLYTFLWIITGIFSGLVVMVIGLALWDRRTVVRRAKEEAVEEVERNIFMRLLNALRDLAKEDEKVARVLRIHGLL